jgi:hypothetical protein
MRRLIRPTPSRQTRQRPQRLIRIRHIGVNFALPPSRRMANFATTSFAGSTSDTSLGSRDRGCDFEGWMDTPSFNGETAAHGGAGVALPGGGCKILSAFTALGAAVHDGVLGLGSRPAPGFTGSTLGAGLTRCGGSGYRARARASALLKSSILNQRSPDTPSSRLSSHSREISMSNLLFCFWSTACMPRPVTAHCRPTQKMSRSKGIFQKLRFRTNRPPRTETKIPARAASATAKRSRAVNCCRYVSFSTTFSPPI